MSLFRSANILILLLLYCWAVASDNIELSRIAGEDQSVRAGKEDVSSDDARRQRVLEILAEGLVVTPTDKFNAGLVLQHTGLCFCDGELQSLSAENYFLAHFLFRQAMKEGVNDAAYLTAASIDRYLSFTKGYQLYGTNRVIDQASGKEYLVPVDRKITDEERALYGVPALNELLKKWPEKQGSEF